MKQYKRIKDDLTKGISAGKWGPGERVPSENQLAQQYGTSRMTARRALAELASIGILHRVQGLGSFVAQRTLGATFHKIRDISDEITSRGRRHTHQIMRLTVATPPETLSLWANEASPKRAGHLCIRHFSDEVPIQYEMRWISLELMPDMLDIDWTAQTPSQILLKRLPLSKAVQRISAVALHAEAARALDVPSNSPGLCIQRLTWSGSDWATYSHFYHPGNTFSLESTLQTEVIP